MEKLSAVAKESQSDQLKKLKDLCEKETENLKKKMDKRWKEKFHEAKSQEKSHRVTEEKKAELKQSHVVEAVHCIRRLEDAQAKRLERLLEKHQDIQQQILDEKPKMIWCCCQLLHKDYSSTWTCCRTTVRTGP
ncbi:1-phosphatidylinositol 4,5-bisphosphate phosphodiesterase beta-1-like isoform X2 [Myxocyprinus asiaticus]|uniref:1-phosphatidylinositol 4,5-bisphosphate phosphodiesterase beta-1-like isoform X2 n=1 Tax=Myxocyprinus asiaticus TaxID=70543 RepID=UPI002223ACC1|nr:1-phosphatidylinositol 4,5-bisphosphate phosphodiesterase beta-1-like isoform X2 [Myxocyprinus asiaticus]